jgi:magnesium-transporting ATPase (P-type)
MRTDALAGEGLRALALARKTADDPDAEPYEDLTLIGLAGLLDPPRPEVREAVRACRDAGIRVVMVTGDQPETARAIAGEVGILDDPEPAEVRLGSDMAPPEKMTEEARAARGPARRGAMPRSGRADAAGRRAPVSTAPDRAPVHPLRVVRTAGRPG